MNIREMLSPEEREEYDALLVEAGLDDNGLPRESAEIGPRMHDLLMDAAQAGRAWAGWVIRDDAEDGHLRRFKGWLKQEKRHKVLYDGVIVSRAAVRGITRKKDDGSTMHQLFEWRDMSWMDIEAQIAEASLRIRSERITISTARKLLALRDRAPGAATPAEAAKLLGLELDDYLLSEEAAA